MQSIDPSKLFFSTGVLVIIAFALSLFSGYPKNVGDLSFFVVAQGALYGTIIFIFFMLLGRFFMDRLLSYKNIMIELRSVFSELTWPMIVTLSVMAGVSEELLFRGVIQNYVISVSNPFIGVLVSAFIFGLMHFYSRIYVLLTFVAGLIIGYIYYQTQSLALIVSLHIVYDILAFASLVKYPHLLGFND